MPVCLWLYLSAVSCSVVFDWNALAGNMASRMWLTSHVVSNYLYCTSKYSMGMAVAYSLSAFVPQLAQDAGMC